MSSSNVVFLAISAMGQILAFHRTYFFLRAPGPVIKRTRY